MHNLSERILESQRLSEIEQVLGAALADVELIGELAINEITFNHLVRTLRRDGTFKNRAARMTEPISYMVSMIFSARYDKDEKRNFWQPYLKDVWQVPRNQSNYDTGRANFNTARIYLENHYKLYFPRKLEGDVVRSVYWHTIIPAYLYDDFARWLSPLFDKLINLSEQALEAFIKSETATTYIAKRLQSFLQEENGIALSLIQELIAAYALYMESGDAQLVYECLPSPIYQSLWGQILPLLEIQTSVGLSHRHRKTRLEWVWSFDDEEWVLRFVNLLTDAQHKPRLVIWSKASSEAAFWDNYHQHELWPERIEGQWRIQERVLGNLDLQKPEMLDARIYVYDGHDKLIQEYFVPPLPSADYLIYRISQQGQYAIPLPLPYKLLDGNYLISYQGKLALESRGKQIEADREFKARMSTANGFHQAALYKLALPLTISINGRIDSYYPSESRQVSAEIRGDGQLENLAIDVPPVFTGGNLHLVFKQLPVKYQHLQFVIRGKESIKHAFLKDFLQESPEGYVLDLAEHLDFERIGSYEIDINYNLQSRLPAPIQFSIAPNLECEAPVDKLFNPLSLPSVVLRSVKGEILVTGGASKQESGNEIQITWHDLREDLLQIQIRDGDSYVPLAWRIQRVAAWFEQTKNTDFLLPNEIEQARLEIRGLANQMLVLKAGQSPYELRLDAKGRFSENIRKTRLKDILTENHDDDVLLQIESYGEAWPLATYVQRPRVLKLEISYFHGLGISCEIALSQQDLGGTYRLQVLNSKAELVLEAPVDSFEKSIDIEYRQSLHPDVYRVQILRDGKALTMPEKHHFEVEFPKLDSLLVDYQSKRLRLEYEIEREIEGNYQLEIWHEGELLCREKLHQTIECQLKAGLYNLRVFWNEHCIYEVEHLIDVSLDDDETNTIEVELSHAERLYRWATLSAVDLLNAYSEQTYREWRTLRRMAEVHQSDVWLHKYGMVPSWAILDKSLRFTVMDKTYPIYPEKVLERGMTGIGKIALNYQQISYAYAHWTLSSHRYVRLQVFVPEKDPDKAPFSVLDEDEMWPAYYDVKSGEIRASRSNSLRPGKQADGGFLVDMVHNYLCLGFLDSNNRHLLHSLRPYENFDRAFCKEYLEAGEMPDVADDEVIFRNILSSDAYRFTVVKWIDRFDRSKTAKQAIQTLTGNEARRAFQAFAEHLLQMAERENIPYLKGVKRFLQSMESQVKTYESHRLMALDRHVFLLAVALRAGNLPASLFQKQIRESLHLSDAELIELLHLANSACPSLLEWALTWAEILFVHSAA